MLDRELWPLDPDVAFLNHGSFGACPRSVLQAQQQLRDRMERQPVAFFEWAWDALSEAVVAPAQLLGCRPEDTVFVENASTGVNAVLRSFDLRDGDAILTTTHAYGAVRNALIYVCQRAGAELIEVELPFPCEGPAPILAALDAALAGPGRVRLAVLDHITSKTGLILPIAEMTARCKAAGVPVLVDGAHVPGHFPVDVPGIGADWYTGNLHKWAFAPRGCALLWVHPDHHATTRPLVISHGWADGLHSAFHWAGTRDLTAWLAAPAAIDFLERAGPERVWQHNRDLAHQAAELLAHSFGTPRPAPTSMCGAMVTLLPPGERPGTEVAALELHTWLRERHGVEVPCFDFDGRVWLRISAQAYNRLVDYERLAEALSSSSR